MISGDFDRSNGWIGRESMIACGANYKIPVPRLPATHTSVLWPSSPLHVLTRSDSPLPACQISRRGDICACRLVSVATEDLFCVAVDEAKAFVAYLHMIIRLIELLTSGACCTLRYAPRRTEAEFKSLQSEKNQEAENQSWSSTCRPVKKGSLEWARASGPCLRGPTGADHVPYKSTACSRLAGFWNAYSRSLSFSVSSLRFPRVIKTHVLVPRWKMKEKRGAKEGSFLCYISRSFDFCTETDVIDFVYFFYFAAIKEKSGISSDKLGSTFFTAWIIDVAVVFGLALQKYLDSSHHSVAGYNTASFQVAGGTAQSASSPGHFLQGDGRIQAAFSSSQLNSPLGSLSNPGTGWSGPGPSSGDMNRVLNSSANSGPSVGASSLVTDANSSLSGGPHLQRSASISTDSYLRLPASPMSFSSNNISMDGSCIVQHSPNQDQNPQIQQRQLQQGGASTATSQPTLQASSQDPTSLKQEPLQKKPRLDIRQEDILQQQFIQQLLQKRDSIQLQGQTPQLQALTQQQRLLQQQQMLQSLPQFQRMQLQQQQQQQLRQQMQYHGMHPVSGMRRPYDSGICARRLMQYMYHQRHRPNDNNILYWRKFVAEYFAPCAKKRWCLSLYDTSAYHSLAVFAQAALDGDLIEFDSGVLDELLFVDSPQEVRLPSGIMMLEYGKAIQESVYDQVRVVREGHLRILFAPDLKVNQLVMVAQKYQSAVTESGSNGISPHDLQTNCNTFATVGRQLAKSLDSQSLNDLGFSKRYVRCLQISEVVSSMKDLMAFSRQQNMGPIESLKNYPRLAAASKLQKMKEGEPLANSQALPNDPNTQNKVTALSPGVSSKVNNNQLERYLKQKAEAAALNNYHRLLRQESIKSTNQNALQQDASRSFNISNQSQSFQGHGSSSAGSLPSTPANGMLSTHQQPHLSPQNQQSFHTSQHIGQHDIQQLLQEMTNNNGSVQQQPQQQPRSGNHPVDVGANGSMLTRAAGMGMMGHENNTANALNSSQSLIPSRNNSFKNAAANSSPSVSEFNLRPDMPQNINLGELVSDLLGESAESLMFDSVTGDMGCGWK
ncbi:hypothetical protein ACLOJK_005118 [Asimina triloba]